MKKRRLQGGEQRMLTCMPRCEHRPVACEAAAAEYLYGRSCCLSFNASLVAVAKGSAMSHHKLFS
jgi:hypothetical protein